MIAGALLGALAVTAVWLYFVISSPALTPRQVAAFDADQALIYRIPPSACGGRCNAEVLNNIGAHSWRIQLSSPRDRRCYIIDVRTFAVTADYGLTGIQTAPCS